MTETTGGDRITVGSVVNSVGVAIGRGAKSVVNIFPGRQEAEDARNRNTLLIRVRHDWIAGVLERSVLGAALIDLGLQARPDAVERPWRSVVQEAGGAPEKGAKRKPAAKAAASGDKPAKAKKSEKAAKAAKEAE